MNKCGGYKWICVYISFVKLIVMKGRVWGGGIVINCIDYEYFW